MVERFFLPFISLPGCACNLCESSLFWVENIHVVVNARHTFTKPKIAPFIYFQPSPSNSQAITDLNYPGVAFCFSCHVSLIVLIMMATTSLCDDLPSSLEKKVILSNVLQLSSS